MCRLLAYTGPNISLYDLILKPEHSLEKQAWQPRELREVKLNADGYGFGWYEQGQAHRYRQPIAIWNDENLQDVSRSMKYPLWLAMVRSATPGLGTHADNTQPFRYQQWLFQHNGYILDFPSSARPQIRHLLDHEFEANIHGNTDSEYIFALILHYLKQHNNPRHAIQKTFQTIADIIGPARALLNIMLSDGKQIIATSHAINGLCPSLYYGQSIKDFPAQSQLLASEAFDKDPNWQPVDEHSIIVMQDNKALQQFPL